MTDSQVERETSSSLEQKFKDATELLGNADDFRTTECEIREIIIKDQRINEDDHPKLESFTAVVYRNKLMGEHLMANQVAFTLNTAAEGNSFGSTALSFFGDTYNDEEIRSKFPEEYISKSGLSDRYSVLYMNNNGDLSPLVYFTRGPNFRREDEPESTSIDFSLTVGVMKGMKELTEPEQRALSEFLIKYFQQGFVSLHELTGKGGVTYPNPIDASGSFLPDKKYYEADPKAKELRDELAELAVMIENSFESRNASGKIISLMDQKAASIYGLVAKEGIDLDNYKFPKRADAYEPYNSAVGVAWNVLKSMFNITNLKANWKDLASGQMKQEATLDGEDEKFEMGDLEVGLRRSSGIGKEERKIMVAQSLINMTFYALDISNEETEEIKRKYGLE